MRSVGIRIANAVLAGAICFQIAGVFNRIVADMLAPTRSYRPVDFASEPAPERTWNDRSPILDRNLFGAQLFPEAAPEIPVIVEEEVEETKLPLVLEGTITGTDDAARAAIRDARARTDFVVGIGDEFEGHAGVSVIGIERRRVLLNNRGRTEELRLDEEEAPTSSSTVTRSEPPSRTTRRSISARRRSSSLQRARRRSPQQSAEHRERVAEIARKVGAGELSPEEVGAAIRELEEME